MSKEATTPLQKHQGKVLTNFGELPSLGSYFLQEMRMHRPPHITKHPMIINLLKNQNGNVVQDDHGVLKTVVHELVPQSMRGSSIIMAPRRQQQRRRRLALHNTQV